MASNPAEKKRRAIQAPPRNMKHTPPNEQLICIHLKPLSPINILLGDGMITVEGGFGGYSEVARPKDTAISDWPGTPALKLAVPIMIDSWIDQGRGPGRVPRAFNKLDRLLNTGRGTPRDERPRQFRMYGKAMPPRTRGHIFGLVDIDWGDTMTFNGNLQRQALVLHVMEYNAADNITIRRHHRRRHHHHNQSGGTSANKVVAKSGDTLQTIAVDQYGDWTAWSDIADANGILNPRDVNEGDILVIP